MSGFALLLILALIVIAVLGLLSDTVEDRSLPMAENGILDLSAYNLNEHHSVPLNGNWRFDWNILASASTLPEQEIVRNIRIPSNWNSSSVDGINMSSKGYATASIAVSLDQNYEQLAISVPKVGSAYRLMINDNEIAAGGTVATNEKDAFSRYLPQVVVFEPPAKEFSIVLQVSNHEFHYAGVWQTIRLGLPENIYQSKFRLILKTAFIVAIFLTICAFNFIQFSLSTQAKTPLLIAFTCICLALREIEDSQLLLLIGLMEFSFSTNVRINYLTFYMAIPLFMYYFYINLRDCYHRAAVQLVVVTSAAFTLFTLLTPISIFSPVMPYFQFFALGVIAYMLVGLIKAAFSKQSNAQVLAYGGIIFAALAVNDILHSLKVIDSILLVSFGLVAFVMCQNYLMYAAFIKASLDNVSLNTTLQQRNADLQAFSTELEDKVTQRTSELEHANHRLASLANEDPLTCLLNRRGLMAEIEQAKKALDRNGTPFCLLIIDFDNFKQLNDTLGHAAGDAVLTSSSEIIRSVIRKHDRAGRWGGEEFLILTVDAKLDIASVIANRLRNEIEKALTAKMGYSVTITIGIAQCAVSESTDSCIKRADDALYKGKNNGRNRVEFSHIE